ncbi:transcription factor bHLH68 isoform X2 [Gossypium raimondii]|uniref:transcription factor bHLH68 isoform X2 n=1 Tax=Gossypium raimondii TaxID=29730 RepID=UPI00063AAE08|nr:transcription factor bHLH68 isoform X2 [Gossypium raimondii]
MNQGVLQSSPVQQLMAGNPDWWSINNAMRPPSTHHHHHHQQTASPFFPFPPPQPPPPPAAAAAAATFFPQLIPTSTSSSSSWHDNNNQEVPEPWSQLLLGGLVGEEQATALQHQASTGNNNIMKQENYVYGHANEDYHHHHHHHYQGSKATTNWSMATASSSPKSCVTTSFNNNMLDFSSNIKVDTATRQHPPLMDPSPEVRKEKLGDRITALHQLVSPFGKTDTASVLLEAIGYIRFLQSQIEALSLPYLGSDGSSGNMRQQQQSVQGERNCIFPEDPGQLLNEKCMKKRKGGPADLQDSNEEPKKNLKSRGLCLVPISCTLQVGSDNGADYWAPPSLGGGFR